MLVEIKNGYIKLDNFKIEFFKEDWVLRKEYLLR